MSIRWIFFDIGSTLIDETEAYNHRIRDIILGTNITFEEFDNKRIELARKGFEGNSEAIKFFGLNKTPWHSEDELPYDDSYDALDYLISKGYKLGVIANQKIGTAERLKHWELLKYFDVIVASAEVGYAKPDKRIFEKAFELGVCTPQESVMVGDRLDNDIIPAKNIGMKTVWIRNGLAVYQDIRYGDNTADWIIDDLLSLKKIF